MGQWVFGPRALAFNQLGAPACVARTVHALELNSLELAVGGLRDLSVLGLGADVNAVVNDVAAKVTESYGAVLAQVRWPDPKATHCDMPLSRPADARHSSESG